ncbi:hypothetical protein TRICI_005991 [Trichomonascus ciferrii]|uniref:Uncharacterized protein n=1 Tax=Trichomonascus ciferrii TaxID=44093 RepID=A0A642UMY0_9ASCO|nr:hypothetical protein TRICI_005991 [Trichomonascus ciferrii]
MARISLASVCLICSFNGSLRSSVIPNSLTVFDYCFHISIWKSQPGPFVWISYSASSFIKKVNEAQFVSRAHSSPLVSISEGFAVLSSRLSPWTEMMTSSTKPMIFAPSSSTSLYNGAEYKRNNNGDAEDSCGTPVRMGWLGYGALSMIKEADRAEMKW